MSKVRASSLLLLIVAFVCLSSGTWGQTSGSDVYYATNYSGADASIKINACIAAVISAGGGVCDASGLRGTQKMSQEIHLGNSASVAAHIGVTLLLPDTATWLWHLTDGSSCGIYQYSSTSLLGHQPAGGGNRMVLAASSGSQMDSIYCTDAPSTGANYVRAEGFAVWNNQSGSTFANGVVHVRDAVDQSRFVGIFAQNYYGDVWHVESACCGATFDDIQGTSNGTQSLSNSSDGGIPLTLGPGKVDGVSFHNSGFNAPGIGHPDIMMKGESAVMGVSFYNTYMEGNGTVDGTTPMVYIGPYVGPVHFFGGVANTEQTTLSNTKSVFENHGFYLDVPAFEAVNTTLGINDVMAGVKIAVWDFSGNLGTIPSYQTKHLQALNSRYGPPEGGIGSGEPIRVEEPRLAF
jgi:hypothetical protein